MSFGLGEVISLAGFIAQGAKIDQNYRNNVARDEANIASFNSQVLLNNALAERNFTLINEEKQAVMVANGFDKFEIAKLIRSNKANALALRGSSGSLSSASLQAWLVDIGRKGGEAQKRKELNFGRHLRNLDIDIENTTITTSGLNKQAFNNLRLTASSAGRQLGLFSTGLKAFQTLGFTKDPSNNKTIPFWEAA